MKSFEKAMDDLKEIISQLESGELSLEKSIKLFEKGTKLIGYSHKKLNEVQKKVQILIQDKDGEISFEDFDTEDEDE